MDSMKKFNAYVGETKVLANMIENENTDEEREETIQK